MINYKKYLGKICDVTWFDACGKQKEELSKINDIPPASLLVLTHTYGLVYRVDDKAILILQEKSEEECDYTCIPIDWVIDINKLK